MQWSGWERSDIKTARVTWAVFIISSKFSGNTEGLIIPRKNIQIFFVHIGLTVFFILVFWDEDIHFDEAVDDVLRARAGIET